MSNLLIGPFLIWLPKIAYAVILILATYSYVKSKSWIKKLIIIIIIFQVLYALALTVSQYYVWSTNDLTRILLTEPTEQGVIFNHRHGYFALYVLGRFWLEVLITWLCAGLFYYLLCQLKKYREEFFEIDEPELGLLTTLLSGWPGFVVFLPLALISLVLYSLFQKVWKKESYTPVGWPLIVAAAITLLFIEKFSVILPLGVLKI